jgi:XRE family transcriptional regulator, regulator of sulfur utilization
MKQGAGPPDSRVLFGVLDDLLAERTRNDFDALPRALIHRTSVARTPKLAIVEEAPLAELKIGARVKTERQRLGLSLRALAERTGFSASFLSQVELDQTTPSLASLAKLAQSLGVTLSALLAEQESPSEATVLRAKDRSALRSDWSKASVSTLLPKGADDRLAVMMIELEPGGRSGNPGSAISGHELALAIKGTVTLRLGDIEQRLAAGDSAYYDASIGPRWSNSGKTRCQILIVNVRFG